MRALRQSLGSPRTGRNRHRNLQNMVCSAPFRHRDQGPHWGQGLLSSRLPAGEGGGGAKASKDVTKLSYHLEVAFVLTQYLLFCQL